MSDFAPKRISVAGLPERDRLPTLLKLVGPVLRLDIEPLPDTAFHADLMMRAMPGLAFAETEIWGARTHRTRELVSDGNDSLTLFINHAGPFIASARRRDAMLGDGDALLVTASDVGSWMRPVPGKSLGLNIPRAALAPLVPNFEDALMRPIPGDSEALRVLTNYLGVLQGGAAVATPALRQLVATHIYDLMALTVGATRDAEILAAGRGGRAARLRAIKVDIVENLGRADLSVNLMSQRHRLAVRYIQRLFELEGMTFSGFLMSQRLARAHRMLGEPRYAGTSIGDIAAACGFADRAYFNRCFRRVFAASPSDIRAAARDA